MARFYDDKRRPSTIVRDNQVIASYRRIQAELGVLSREVSRQYIYERISADTGLYRKTIANVLNNCRY